jgi:hypothetical protein
MKDLMHKFLLLIGFIAVITSCQEEDLVVINEDFTTTVALSDTDIVLEEANEDLNALTVAWDEPDFGYNAAAEYNILFTLGANMETVNAGRPMADGGMMKKDFTTGELNRILLNLEAEPGAATALDVHVDVILSKQVKKASEPVGLTATAYSGVLDLTSPWGVVGDATPNGWGDRPDTPFYKTDEAGVYVAYITMIDGDWKIRKDNDWTVNYGSGDGVNLEQDGPNIAVSAGTYKITFDENNLIYSIEPYTWGLVGSATPNGWGDGPDTPLVYDACSDTWKAIINMIDGEWKIRQNNDWAVNYGMGGAPGTLESPGENIPVTAGTYQITVNFNDLTYEIVEAFVWGVVGSGYNNWGADGPDFPFEADFCNEGIYYAYDVPLIDGEIKFRQNNSWDAPNVNYGDKQLDGILDTEDGNNIPVTEGIYDIVLDFTNPSVPTYTLTAK